jgi:hypothetical protein
MTKLNKRNAEIEAIIKRDSMRKWSTQRLMDQLASDILMSKTKLQMETVSKVLCERVGVSHRVNYYNNEGEYAHLAPKR